jgi:sterigmatocystin 8-O-methyltransferase
MAGHYNTPLDEPIENIFPFNSLDPNALVVDIGGGNGQHSMRLGKKFPGMSFIVQDHVTVVEGAQRIVLEPMPGKIQWQSQDIFSPQQVEGASIYLLSHVLMDHSARYESSYWW